ncbi:MAG: SDR family oxidoreductase [Desulfocapsaceae bacterium]|nr:SDR family oxidoreductase [Desulfocapsaceae bacterium]
MQLNNKIALVPGASREVGRAIARRLADEGVQLVLPYYDWPESSQEMIDEFTKRGCSFFASSVDLTNETAIEDMVEEIEKRFGRLDFLVNNIERGGMPVVHGPYSLEHNRGQWDLEVNTTLKAKWLLFNHCLPLLRKAKEAAVVNISSIAAIVGRSGPAELLFNDGYSAANKGIANFTTTWAREAAPSIRVNELMLGLVKHRHGEGTRGWASLAESAKSQILDHILLDRTGLPEEVAATVYFLLAEATYMTGSVIRMDGGYILGGEKTSDLPEGVLSQRP